jgi:hypothetical protein
VDTQASRRTFPRRTPKDKDRFPREVLRQILHLRKAERIHKILKRQS